MVLSAHAKTAYVLNEIWSHPMNSDLSKEKGCKHDPLQANTLVVESNWAAGVRIRCKRCGNTAYVGKKGRVTPERTPYGT